MPDDHGVLTAAPDLVYNDAPWLGAQQEAAHLVHPKISFEARTRADVLMTLLAWTCKAGPFALKSVAPPETITLTLIQSLTLARLLILILTVTPNPTNPDRNPKTNFNP